MSKRGKRIDPNQLSFDFDDTINECVRLKQEILAPPAHPINEMEDYREACIVMAAAAKCAVRESGMSRDEVVDAINDLFGWPREPHKKGKSLSIHMFNHYLSKPAQYPIPAFILWAVQHVTKSLTPTRAFAESEDARVISGDEVRQMALGKLDETILEMQRLKRELRGRK